MASRFRAARHSRRMGLPVQRRPGSCYAGRYQLAAPPRTGINGRRAMNLSRRDLAATAGVLALGTAAFAGPVLANTEDEAAVKKAVEELKAAYLKQDKAKLEAMTLPQLSYSHSDARVEDKAKFIEGVMGRKATVKSLEFSDMTVLVAGKLVLGRLTW